MLVEDEVKVAAFIKKGLQTQDYTVDVALTGLGSFALYVTFGRQNRFPTSSIDLTVRI